MIKKGQIYKHFKGNHYYIEDIAYDSASNELEELVQIVIYRALYGDNKLWVRPLIDFESEKVLSNGDKIKRFKLIEFEQINILNRNI